MTKTMMDQLIAEASTQKAQIAKKSNFKYDFTIEQHKITLLLSNN